MLVPSAVLWIPGASGIAKNIGPTEVMDRTDGSAFEWRDQKAMRRLSSTHQDSHAVARRAISFAFRVHREIAEIFVAGWSLGAEKPFHTIQIDLRSPC